VDARAFVSPKGLRPRRRVKPGHDDAETWLKRAMVLPLGVKRISVTAEIEDHSMTKGDENPSCKVPAPCL
jgi:hypothetical protein